MKKTTESVADVAAKVPRHIKVRLSAFAKKQMVSESAIIRKALDSFLPQIAEK